MTLTNDQMLALLTELKSTDAIVKPVAKPSISRITVADSFDLRYITKVEAKKLSTEALHGLIRYAMEYLDSSSQFLYRVTKNGRKVADFEEAGANREIQSTLEILNKEFTRRKE